MQDIPHFLGLILWNFWTVAAGVMLAFEPVMRWFFEKYDATAARYIPPEKRRNAARLAAVCAFVFANYLAFHDLSEENRSLKAEKTASSQSPYKWPMLTPEESEALRIKLRDIPPQSISISCTEDDCGDLARSFRDVFNGLHWNVMCCGYPFGGLAPGIFLWTTTPQFMPITQNIELATNGRLKVETAKVPIWDGQKFPLQITIGAKIP